MASGPPPWRRPRRCNNSANESSRHTYSAAACVPKVVVPARIRTERAGSMPGTSRPPHSPRWSADSQGFLRIRWPSPGCGCRLNTRQVALARSGNEIR